MKAIRDAVRAGRLRGLLVFGEDLLEARFETEDLRKLELLVTAQILTGPMAGMADVVLPAAAWAEKRGSMINVQGRIQRLNRAVASPGQARDDWEILAELIRDAGGKAGWRSVDELFAEMAGEIDVMGGLSLAKIGDLGRPLVETGVKIPLLEREAERKARGLIAG